MEGRGFTLDRVGSGPVDLPSGGLRVVAAGAAADSLGRGVLDLLHCWPRSDGTRTPARPVRILSSASSAAMARCTAADRAATAPCTSSPSVRQDRALP